MIKKYITTIVVALGLFVSSAVAQNIRYDTIFESVCIGNICVEVVDMDTKPVIITEYFIAEGTSKVIANQLFFAVDGLPCFGQFSQPINLGSQVVNGRRYNNVWLLPIADGTNDQKKMVFVNNTTRVIGIPSESGKSYSIKVYQMNLGKTVAFVFKNNMLINVVRNVKPSYKFAKGTDVVVLHAEP